MRDIQNLKGSIKGPNEKACTVHTPLWAGHVERTCEQEPATEKHLEISLILKMYVRGRFILEWSDTEALKYLGIIFASADKMQLR